MIPTLNRSMAIAVQDLKLARLFVVYPGEESYRLAENIEVISYYNLPSRLAKL